MMKQVTTTVLLHQVCKMNTNPYRISVEKGRKNSPSLFNSDIFLHPLNILILEGSFLLNLQNLLLVTCTGLFLGCCLAVHSGQADPGEPASPLEALQAADEGSQRLVSPANTGDLHSSPRQREQQTITHCHRTHRPNHREELTSHLSDKWSFKFHFERLDEKTVVIERKATNELESNRPNFEKVSGSEDGSWLPSR